MKWIGQHIYDLASRFRNDVYLEDISTGTIASGAHLGLDSNNKIVKAVDGGGDITSVALSADDENTSIASSGVANFIISGGAGIDTTLAGSTVTITGETADDENAGIVELATTAETTAGIDTARAVTPDGLKDGYQGSTNVTTLGTIGTGVWRGTTIKTAYIGDDQITEDKLANPLLAEIDANTAKVTNVATNLTATTHASQIRIESSDGGDVVIAEASGTIAGVMTVAHHDKLDAIEAEATADQSKSDIDGLAITTVGTLDTGNATAVVDAASATTAGKVELATTAEADTGTDTTRAVTPAGLKSHVDARYAYQYVMFFASDVIKSNWITLGNSGLTNHSWGTDTSDNGVTVGSSTMACTNVMQAAAFQIPFACKLVGFYGTGYRYGGDSAFAGGVFILDSPDYNSAASGSGVDTVNATLRAYADAEQDGSTGFNQRLNKIVDTSRSFDCPAGSMIFPAFKDTAGVNSGSFRGNMTIILATPIITIA